MLLLLSITPCPHTAHDRTQHQGFGAVDMPRLFTTPVECGWWCVLCTRLAKLSNLKLISRYSLSYTLPAIGCPARNNRTSVQLFTTRKDNIVITGEAVYCCYKPPTRAGKLCRTPLFSSTKPSPAKSKITLG